jgi:16S rRNA (cytosine967-C5)-methyltransferase
VASASDDRRRAAGLLIRVEGGAFASRLLDSEASPGVRARVLGVLRWQRALDHRLAPFLKRPLPRLDPEVRTVLRLGCFEGVLLGVPGPVATDAMVGLVRDLRKGSATGMVNAVLRRALAAKAPDEPPPDLRWSHPGWLWRRWSAAFGARAAEQAMAAAQTPAPPWVWFADERARAAVEGAGAALRSHPWCPGAWTADERLPVLMAEVSGGGAVVQDPSSQLVARVAADLSGGRGDAVDLCAAPGGKTALIRRRGSWSRLVAADLNLARAARLGRRLGGTGVVVADATRPPLAPVAWDLVLLDAPCSGTGTLRRHPELKWRLTAQEIVAAADRQRPMIGAALELVRPRGLLVYATCSVEAEENEAHFEPAPAGFRPVDLGGVLPAGLSWSETSAGGARILPHEHGDGFTLHALRRAPV